MYKQASELEAMAAQKGSEQTHGGGAPWRDEGARRQLAARVRVLEQDHDRCAQARTRIFVCPCVSMCECCAWLWDEGAVWRLAARVRVCTHSSRTNASAHAQAYDTR